MARRTTGGPNRAGLAVAAAAVALVAAACGSSSTTTSTTSAAAAATTSSSTGAATTAGTAASAVKLTTAKGPAGTYLTDASGRALYLWVADSAGKSNCSGACAAAWPPLVTSGAPTAAGGAMSADLGTVARSDGTKQVTYKGHPLYRFAGDAKAGETTGQGSNGFGAKWWLVSPAGTPITSGGSGGAGGGSSSSSSSYSGY